MENRRPRIVAAVFLGVAGSLLFTGCGSGAATPVRDAAGPGTPFSGASSPAGSRSGGTACSLITEQEAGTALGADPGAGIASTHGAGVSSCRFGKAPSLLTVDLQPSGGKAVYDKDLGQAADAQPVDITVVGDKAFGIFHAPVAIIDFLKGSALGGIFLEVKGASTPPQDQATVLAKLAAGRM